MTAIVRVFLIGFITAVACVSPSQGSAGSSGSAPISSVDPISGNLLVNGSPFLMIRGDNVDYNTALGNVAYKITQWDAHLAAMKSAGMNVIAGNWTNLSDSRLSPSLFDDVTFNRYQNIDLSHWQRFGTRWWGDAGGNATPPSCAIVPPDKACIAGYMNAHKSQANLILWQISGELQVGAPPSAWSPVWAAMRSIDPTRTGGDYILTNNPNLQRFSDLRMLAVPIPEVVLHPPWPFLRSTETSGASIGQIHDVLDAMDAAWNGGHRFVYGMSITPIPELGNLTAPASFATTSSTPVSPGSVTVTPAAMRGTTRGLTWSIIVGTGLQIDTGSPQETVTVTAVTATTFTATFVSSHRGTWKILGYYPGSETFPPRLQVRRAHWYMVARNCRQFAMLWGPNQRGIPYSGNGDTALTTGAGVTTLIWNRDVQNTLSAFTTGQDGTVTDPVLTHLLDNGRLPSALDVFGYWTEVIMDITSLKTVILDAQRWTHLTTNPQDSPDGGGGIYAASKTVDGVTYVIACNLQQSTQTYGGDTFSTPAAVNNARIALGQTIKTATRLFEAGSVSFSRAVITDNFRPMECHLYKVT